MRDWAIRSTDIAPLFEYLYWLRDGGLAKAAELDASEFLDTATVAYRDLRATLVHQLDVQRSWRLRLQGAPKEVCDVELASTDGAAVQDLRLSTVRPRVAEPDFMMS